MTRLTLSLPMAQKFRQGLLRDALNALNRMDAHEGLCDQIRAALFTKDED